MNVLVVDVGGNRVKLLATGCHEPAKLPSGPALTPQALVAEVLRVTAGWEYDVISLGVPGPVKGGRVVGQPHNLGPGWAGFDFGRALGRPVKVINDAAMQALGSYQGGRMLFLGLGTGLGAALVIEGIVHPLELAHLPYRKGHTFEDYVGRRGLQRFGLRRWRGHVADVVERLRVALQADYVVLGGGNAKHVPDLPPGVRRGRNANAFTGGFRLWQPAHARETAPDGAAAPPDEPPVTAPFPVA